MIIVILIMVILVVIIIMVMMVIVIMLSIIVIVVRIVMIVSIAITIVAREGLWFPPCGEAVGRSRALLATSAGSGVPHRPGKEQPLRLFLACSGLAACRSSSDMTLASAGVTPSTVLRPAM